MSEIVSLAGAVATAAVALFVVTVMFSIGLEVTARECLAVLRNRRLMISALLANFVLVPLFGLGIARVLPMPPGIETGFLVLAAAPGAVLAINFTRTMRDSMPTVAALLFLLTISSIVLSPPLIKFLLRLERPVTLSYEEHFRAVILEVISPLLVGLALNRWKPDLARALRKPASTCAAIFFAAGVVLMLSVRSAAMKQIATSTIVAMLVFILGSMAIGWIIGGPDRASRRIMAVNTSMRNVALGLAIAARSFSDYGEVAVAMVAFSALMLPPNLLFTLYHSRRITKAQSSARTKDAA